MFKNLLFRIMGWSHCLNCKERFGTRKTGGIPFKGSGGRIQILKICGKCQYDYSRLHEDEIGYQLHVLGMNMDDILTAEAVVIRFKRKALQGQRTKLGIA